MRDKTHAQALLAECTAPGQEWETGAETCEGLTGPPRHIAEKRGDSRRGWLGSCQGRSYAE